MYLELNIPTDPHSGSAEGQLHFKTRHTEVQATDQELDYCYGPALQP